jgi:hypothetical protein
MIGVKRIEFEQLEGPSGARRARAFFSWADINIHVRNAAQQAPTTGGLRCEVLAIWQDGARRYITFEIVRAHGKEWAAVSEAFLRDVLIYSGRGCPDGMSDKDYGAFLERFESDIIEHAARLLDGDYDLGVRE